jgi:hypothetical protein
MTVYVTFEGVTYKSKPLIWLYDEKEKSALLAFECEPGESLFNRTKVMQYLKKSDYSKFGMVFTPNTVKITDVHKLKSIHRMMEFEWKNTSGLSPRKERSLTKRGLSDSKLITSSFSSNSSDASSPNPYQRTPSIKEQTERFGLKNSPSTFFNKPTEEKIKKSGLEVKDDSTKMSLVDIRKQYSSILIKDLILKRHDPEIYRLTRGVTGIMSKVSAKNAKSVSAYLLRGKSFLNEAQHDETNEMYPEKARLTGLIATLLEHHLQPIYAFWCQDKELMVRKELYFFIQTAIHHIVEFNHLDSIHTELERDPEFWIKEFSNNQARLNYAITQIYRAQAEIMFVDLRYLLDKNIPLELIITQPDPSMISEIANLHHQSLRLGDQFLNQGDVLVDTKADRKKMNRIVTIMDMINLLRPFDKELDDKIIQINNINSKRLSRSKGVLVNISYERLSNAEAYLKLRLKQLALYTFKELMTAELDSNPGKVGVLKEQIESIHQSIIELLKIRHKHKKNAEMLKELLENKDELMINHFFSFRPWLENYLKLQFLEHNKSSKSYQKDAEYISNRICQEIISELSKPHHPSELNTIVPQLPISSDHTFYLCHEWTIEVNNLIESLCSTNFLKKTDNKKVVEPFIQNVVKAVVGFFIKASQKLIEESEKEEIEQSSPSLLT